MVEAKIQKKPEGKEMIILKNDTFIDGVFYPEGTQIEVTAEIKELLRPLGYFNG